MIRNLSSPAILTEVVEMIIEVYCIYRRTWQLAKRDKRFVFDEVCSKYVGDQPPAKQVNKQGALLPLHTFPSQGL